MTTMTATYSPEDNKLRLYSATRLPKDIYERIKAAGFRYAPKQELFFAPAWTPGREDVLLELCGEIGDEDTSLVERAEQRAERFEGYQVNRSADADRAQEAVKQITSGIPLGQPILVGHHSERHARRHQERIESGMRKAVKMWETAQYWESRAAGAIQHAKYKELPDVRVRRIKTIEADKRKAERAAKEATANLALWAQLEATTKGGETATAEIIMQRALWITNRCYISACFPLDKYPRVPPASQYEGQTSLWSALDGGVISPQQARVIAERVHTRTITRSQRWITHCSHRLTYERAMLEEQGASDLLKPKARPKQLPLCNYRAPEGLDVENKYRRGEIIHYGQVEMTQAEYAKIYQDYKGTRVVGNSHRVRTALINRSLVCVFITDSKQHTPPPAVSKESPALPERRTAARTPAKRAVEEPTVFEKMKQTLRAGVQIVVAPQLFQTPTAQAAEMADIACLQPGDRMLDPNAGTGRLLDAARVAGAVTTAIEINGQLVQGLRQRFDDVRQADFLQVLPDDVGTFDVILMNPPFTDAADIKHIRHAVKFLRPGGRLVAICANGPRQRDQLGELVEQYGGTWDDLPGDLFKEEGTSVQAARIHLQV